MSISRILITGWTGFTGRHLVSNLANKGHELYGLSSGRHGHNEGATPIGLCHPLKCDLLDRALLRNTVARIAPDTVFHLASDTGSRSDDFEAESCIMTNVVGTINLLDAIRHAECDPVILVVGSSAQFGKIPVKNNPIEEDADYQPVNIYAVSKIAQAMTAVQYFNSYGMKIIRTHTFNCIGPGQPISQIPSAFIHQLCAIEKGEQEKMIVGNLDSKRDFTDIRDVVRAYVDLVEKGIPGQVYNVCSGKIFEVRKILEILIDLAKVPVLVESRMPAERSTDISIQQGSYRKLYQTSGWQPEISVEDSLRDMLQEARCK